MGPGMAVKAALPRHFSIIVFGLSQIVIDVEVLNYLLRYEYPLHRFWHTYLGATIIAVGCAVIGKPLSQWIKYLWNLIAPKNTTLSFTVAVPTTWTASFMGACVGVYSHIFLDSIYHSDLKPLWPLTDTNHMYNIVSPHTVEITCLLLGITGLVWFFARHARGR